MTLEDSIHTQRLRVLREAQRLGNVSEACRRHGMSRTLFYRLRQRFDQYGADGVHPKRVQAAVGRPSPIPGADGAPRDRAGLGASWHFRRLRPAPHKWPWLFWAARYGSCTSSNSREPSL